MEFRTAFAIGRYIPLFRRLLPLEVQKHPSTLWKAENLVIAGVIAILVMPSYGLFYHVLGDDINAVLCAAATMGGILALLMLRLAKSIVLSREMLVVTIFILLLAMTYRLGGIHAPTVIWLAVCPLIAATVGGLRPAVMWAGLCFAAVVAVHLVDGAGAFPAPIVGNMRLLTTVSTLSFVMTVAIFVLLLYQTNALVVSRLEQALEVIRNLAIRDELTGVFNRRELLRVAALEKQRAERHGAPFSLCLIDVDDFKRINDTYGHAVGDHVLKRIAAIVQTIIRETDCFGRYGGEEFLLLTGSDAHAAREVTERIRAAVEHMRFEQAPAMRGVTISIGVAQYLPGETIEQALSRADHALYAAKGDGRNRVVVAACDTPVAAWTRTA